MWNGRRGGQRALWGGEELNQPVLTHALMWISIS